MPTLPVPYTQKEQIVHRLTSPAYSQLDLTMRLTSSSYTLSAALVIALAKSGLGFSFTARTATTKANANGIIQSPSSFASWGLPRFSLATTCGESIIQLSSSTQSLTEGDEIELDEDEYDLENIRSFADYHQELTLLARTTSKDPTAVAKATAVFDNMFEAYVMTEDAGLWPNTTIYNLILEVHAYSTSTEGAQHAQDILQRMENPETEGIARPNLESYAKVMEAWAKRKQPDRVEQVMDRIESSGLHLQADTYIYNRLIRAYGMAGQADKALAVLETLLEAADEDPDNESTLNPNYKTWLYVMRAFAQPQHTETGVATIQSLMEQMALGFRQGQEDWQPGFEIYNALLRALSYQKGKAKEAEGILYKMIEQYKQGAEEMRPNAESFYNVIQAYRRVSDAGVAFKVEKLLELQEALRDGDDSTLKPSARTYNAAMAAMSRARDPKKALKSKRLLDRMKDLYQDGDDSFAPTLSAYRSLLNACAYTDGEPQDKLAAFQIAVDTLKELRESDALEADCVVYSLFLRACANLMPTTRKRDAVIENVFLKCCKDGLVSDGVLADFENGASDELQLKILGGFLADGVQPPAEWSRNAARQR